MRTTSVKEFTPYFNARHTRSQFNLDSSSSATLFHHCKRKDSEVNIKRKFSHNKIDDLDDVFAITLTKDKISSCLSKNQPQRKSNTYQVPMRKYSNNNLERKSIDSKQFSKLNSSVEISANSSLGKRSLESGLIVQVNIKLDKFLNQSVRAKFKQKTYHPTAQWVNLVQQMERLAKGELKKQSVINISKLVLWRQSKLCKRIQEIYEELYKYIVHEKQNQSKQISLIIKNLMLQKYKTEKLMKQNTGNLIYSLQYHLNRLKHGNLQSEINIGSYLAFFQEIIQISNDYNKTISYLILRKSMLKVCNSIEIFNLYINKQQLNDFINLISDGNIHIASQYFLQIRSKFKQQSNIYCQDILLFLAGLFCLKAKHKTSRKNLNHINYQYDQQFWPLCFPKNAIQKQLVREINYQSRKLINILCQDLSIQYRAFVQELLTIKANQVATIIRTYNNTSKIFIELGLNTAQFTQDILEKWRSCIDKLNQLNQIKDKNWQQNFAKAIITTPFMTHKLYELIQYFYQFKSKGNS